MNMKMIFKLGDLMSNRENYNTKQKELINNYIKNMNDLFSSKEIYEKMKNDNLNIGLTTIYRHLEDLEKNNVLKKIYKNGIAKYQYLESCECDNHFYLKCDKCGAIAHIDCDCINDCTNHVLNNHSFKVKNDNIIITGLCNKCKNKR